MQRPSRRIGFCIAMAVLSAVILVTHSFNDHGARATEAFYLSPVGMVLFSFMALREFRRTRRDEPSHIDDDALL